MGAVFDGNSWAESTANYNRASSDHTISYWLRVDSTTGTRRPFGNAGLWESRAAGTTLTSDYLQSGTLDTVTLTTSTVHHVVWVQDVTGTTRISYLDGVLNNTIAGATFAAAQNALNMIGVTPGGAGQGWNGVIDDIRVYDRVLGADEVQTIYHCRGRDGILESLVMWYPMNEGAEGTTTTGFVDVIGGINCTTITGTPQYNYDVGITFGRGVL